MTIYGQTQGHGVGAPIAALYAIDDHGSAGRGSRGSAHPPSGGSYASRLQFGRFVAVDDDQFLGVEGELLPVHIREMRRKGTLREMDPSVGAPEFHRVVQYAVAIETTDRRMLSEHDLDVGGRFAITLACMVEHTLQDSHVWYSADRGLLLPDERVVSPMSFVVGNRQAALKKWDSMVTAWEESPGFETARFHHALGSDPEDWQFGIDKQPSTAWQTTRSWLADAERRRQVETEKLLKAPLSEMADETFAQVFQQQMVRGKK